MLLLFAGIAAAVEGAGELLRKADAVKSSQYADFKSILASLAARSQDLPPFERQYLRYLQAWQIAYEGNYDSAIPIFKNIVQEPVDLTLQFRAYATMVNVLAIAKHYDEAFPQLNRLLELLPQVTDKAAREQGLAVAALLYNRVGDYDLGMKYANTLMEENWAGRGTCKGGELSLEALYKSGRLRAPGPELRAGIDACGKAEDPIAANLIRTYVARLHLDQGRFDDAIRLLTKHYDEATQTQYANLMSEYDALLTQAYHKQGNAEQARRFALRTIERGVRDEPTEPRLTAYRVLYELAREDGDLQSALTFHEQYAATARGYLDDVSARQLAYERARHELEATKLQIDALNQQNQVLRLERENARLYIVLLILVLGFIGFWAYKTKRSQLHFMRLARVDGLTGIANRPHFLDMAERALENSHRAGQEVSVVLCDLDYFKSINDKFGHATGDFVLKQVVTACQQHLRASDLFGRFGGEEFGFLLPGCEPQTARQRCEQLRAAIAGVAIHPGSLVSNVSASFGIAATRSSGYELRELLAHADAALYRAKHAGRNCVVLHEHGRTEPPPETAPPDVPTRALSPG